MSKVSTNTVSKRASEGGRIDFSASLTGAALVLLGVAFFGIWRGTRLESSLAVGSWPEVHSQNGFRGAPLLSCGWSSRSPPSGSEAARAGSPFRGRTTTAADDPLALACQGFAGSIPQTSDLPVCATDMERNARDRLLEPRNGHVPLGVAHFSASAASPLSWFAGP